jgi:hypothetical protein
MALLDHCLITPQERDKSARLLSRDKSEEAFRAKDLLQDFTDFTTNGDYGKRGRKPF